MSLLKRLFGGTSKLDGNQLAQATDMKQVAQIDLLMRFATPRPAHDAADQQRWTRVLPQPYADTLTLFERQGWLVQTPKGEFQITPVAQPFVDAYGARLAQAKAEIMPQVRAALQGKETSEALTLRRAYEATFPLGKADWTGPDPQLSHSSLTRRIFFLDHWLLDGMSKPTVDWLKLYAAEQHLWGAFWQLSPSEIPDFVHTELAHPDLPIAEAVYWKAHGLALYVDNQETWQRCKGGDHVRRIEIVGPDDAHTCEHCRQFVGKEYLVAASLNCRIAPVPHPAAVAVAMNPCLKCWTRSRRRRTFAQGHTYFTLIPSATQPQGANLWPNRI